MPYDAIETDWLTFVATFGWNSHRQTLIESLTAYINYLDELSIRVFDLWVDGSFVTRKEQPNDIDIVVFLPADTHQLYEQSLRSTRTEFQGLDIYFVRKIDKDEHNHFLYVADRTEWLFQFTKTRFDKRTRQKYPKGFVQLS